MENNFVEINMTWKKVYELMKEKYPKEFEEFINILKQYYEESKKQIREENSTLPTKQED